MVQHMLLSMVVPLALALGAPVTLALRTLPARPAPLAARRAALAGRQGADLPAAHVRALRRLAVGALLLRLVRRHRCSSAFVHEMMHVHLVLVGALFFWPLVGVDPVPGRVGYPFRVLLIVLTLPFHAFLGVTIMGQTDAASAATHYPALRDGPMGAWLPDPLDDQHLAGGILWAHRRPGRAGVLRACSSPSGCARRCRRRAREDRRLDLLEAPVASRPRRGRAAGSMRPVTDATQQPAR